MEMWEKIWGMIVSSNILRLIWALAILLVGWLLAMLASSQAAQGLQKLGLGRKLGECLPDGSSPGEKVEKIVSKVIFYLILLFALLGALEVLNLRQAAGPIQGFVDKITVYSVNIIAALLLSAIAWVVASVLRYAAVKGAKTLKIAHSLQSAEDQKGESLVSTIGNVVYWVTLLFFVPAILRALKIEGITAPLEQMFIQIMDFLPLLLAAALILFLGLKLAGIVKNAVSGALSALRLDEFGEKAGCGKILGKLSISNLIGVISYVLVAIPVLAAALNALKIEALSNSVSGLLDTLLQATGNIFAAAVVIVAAVIIGGIVAGLVSQLAVAAGFDNLIAKMGLAGKGEDAVKASAVLGKITLISIILFASVAAATLLGFTALAEIIQSFIVFGGNILLGMVVMLIGLFLADFAAGLLQDRGGNSALPALLVRIAVLIFTGAIALSTMDIGGNIVELAFGLLLGAVSVAIALAFGLGGREFAARKLNDWNDKLNQK
ncbi:MAG: mechanosensitive ion channel [Oligosphaeraceae bacterium]|nr:mechanosensitive ion channel [Oligosphaeraceae bacterium]